MDKLAKCEACGYTLATIETNSAPALVGEGLRFRATLTSLILVCPQCGGEYCWQWHISDMAAIVAADMDTLIARVMHLREMLDI